MFKVFTIAAAMVAALSLVGCQTYSIEKVSDEGAARGYPFIFQKPYLATVTYADGSPSTVHVASVPVLFGVDVERAALGTTNTEFESTEAGWLKKGTADLDQKIPENIAAITELLKTLGVTVANAPVAPGAPEVTFQPDIPAGTPIAGITFTAIK